MVLLERMEFEAYPALGGKLSERDMRFYREARKEFLTQLDCSLTGVEKVKAIYRLLDDLTAKYLETHSISCRKNCPWCCYQVIGATTLEMEVILDYIGSLAPSQRLRVKKKAKKAGLKYAKFLKVSTGVVRARRIDDSIKQFYSGKPCLYLEGSECLIYPARTIDCRIAKTDSKICGQHDAIAQVNSIRLFVDTVAADLITDEEQKMYGALHYVLLAAWPVTERFARNFF